MSREDDEVARLLEAAAAGLEELVDQADEVARIADAVVETLAGGGTLFLCGNGGSAAQCQHIAAEFTGRFKVERGGLRAISLTTDTSALTAIGNDYGFDQVFARQLEALARPGDLLIGLSTSGQSANIVRAFESAKRLGVKSIALVGRKGCRMAELADLCLAAPGDGSATIQQCHIVALHAVCDVAERELTSGEQT